MFVGKARTYPIEVGVALGLAHKQKTRLERLAWLSHFSLLQKFVNYVRKKFYNIGPGISHF
jgi:hypothetical protein